MIAVGEQATWPKILFIANRMATERLIEEGLRSSGADQFNQRRIGPMPSRQQQGTKMAPGPGDTTRVKHRRSSILEEVIHQAGVFFDDTGPEGDTTGESEVEEQR